MLVNYVLDAVRVMGSAAQDRHPGMSGADALTFNGDGQMLAMSSRLKRDALRLVHLPSCTVFSNWPSSKTPLHYVWCTAFSPTGGYLAVGNARGKALLYRIHAYGTGGKDE